MRSTRWSPATEQRLAAVGLVLALCLAAAGVVTSAARVGAGALPVVSGPLDAELAAACPAPPGAPLARTPTHGRSAGLAAPSRCEALGDLPETSRTTIAPTTTAAPTTTSTTLAPTTTHPSPPPTVAPPTTTTTAAPAPPPTMAPPPAQTAGGPVRDTAAEAELRSLLSQRRAELRQPDFASSAPLTDCAARWSYKMAVAGRADHSGSSGDSSDSCMAYTFQVCGSCTGTAENVGQTTSAAGAWSAWLASSGHRANIDHPGPGIAGIGVYRHNGYLWLTMVFGYTG